jgi:hypothetical protein
MQGAALIVQHNVSSLEDIFEISKYGFLLASVAIVEP